MFFLVWATGHNLRRPANTANRPPHMTLKDIQQQMSQPTSSDVPIAQARAAKAPDSACAPAAQPAAAWNPAAQSSGPPGEQADRTVRRSASPLRCPKIRHGARSVQAPVFTGGDSPSGPAARG